MWDLINHKCYIIVVTRALVICLICTHCPRACGPRARALHQANRMPVLQLYNVCMYVCMYVRTYVRTCIYVCMYICITIMYSYINAYMIVNTDLLLYVIIITYLTDVITIKDYGKHLLSVQDLLEKHSLLRLIL